ENQFEKLAQFRSFLQPFLARAIPSLRQNSLCRRDAEIGLKKQRFEIIPGIVVNSIGATEKLPNASKKGLTSLRQSIAKNTHFAAPNRGKIPRQYTPRQGAKQDT